MELKDKIADALRRSLEIEHLELQDDDGIFGVAVSDQFRGVSALDRQKLIHEALREAPLKLTRTELRRILAIAPLTPAEYAAMGRRGL